MSQPWTYERHGRRSYLIVRADDRDEFLFGDDLPETEEEAARLCRAANIAAERERDRLLAEIKKAIGGLT